MSWLRLLRGGMPFRASFKFHHYRVGYKGELMAENSGTLFAQIKPQIPQLNLARPTVSRMWLVSLCSFLAIIQSSLEDNFSSLLIALCAAAAAVLTELLFLYPGGKVSGLKDGSALASALIFTLLLPNRIPLLYVVIGAVFAIAVVKHSFGGLGSNWLNPAAGGWLFIRMAWPDVFTRALEGSPLALLSESFVRGASNAQGSPLGILKIDYAAVFNRTGRLQESMRSFFNSTIFSLTGAELPGGYLDLFVSETPGIIADRGILALLVGTVIILAFQVNRSWIPAAWLGVYGFMVYYTGALPFGGDFFGGDILFAFLSGGVLPAAFFLAADPATGAKSRTGILIACAAGGFLAWLFRYYGDDPYGAIFAVILVNALLPMVRAFETRSFYTKRGPP
jgi:electron transport complex protein RnfD